MRVAQGIVAAVPNELHDRARWGTWVVVLLAAAALMIQLLCAFDEINRRSIAPATGIAHMSFDLEIEEITGAGQAGIEVGDRIRQLNGQAVSNGREYRQTIDRLPLRSEVLVVVQRSGEMVSLPAVMVQRRALKVGSFVARHLAGLLYTLIALWVALVRPGVRAAQLFFLASLGLGLYLVLAGTENDALIYVQSAALALTPAFAVHFFLVFPKEWTIFGKRWRPLLYLPSFILLGVTAAAYYRSIQAGSGIYVAPAYWTLHSKVDFVYLAFSGVFGLVALGFAYARVERGVERRRLQWIMWGLGLASLTAIVDVVFTQFQMHTKEYNAILMLGVLPLPLAFAFSILRYRLWDIDLVLNRSAVYGLLTAVLAAVYVLLVSALSAALGIDGYGTDSAAVLFISALTIGILINPLRARIQSVIDRTFFRSAIDHQKIIASWSEELSTSLRFADLMALLLVEVPHTLQLERAWLLVLDKDETALTPMAGEGAVVGEEMAAALSIDVHSPLTGELNRPGRVVLLHDKQELAVRYGDVLNRWEGLGVRVALPLVSGGRLVGIYLLGNKLSGDVYQRADLDLLRTLANQSAVAISNARLYEEVHAFSQEMEAKVRERTKELRDFVSVVYHELSTPITSVRGYTEVLLDGAPGPLTDRQTRYLAVIERSIGRLMRLVGDLSDVSKIDDGRLTIHPVPMDLAEAVAETLASLSGLIEEKGLQVLSRVAKDARQVIGDPQRVVQILTNLVGNACHYTPVGGRVDVCATRLNGRAEVTVSDTGIGIGKEDLDTIFERFRRGSDPYVQDQSGTGLGLSITRSLVELHGSKLWVNSTVGKGSTFGFALRVTEAVDE